MILQEITPGWARFGVDAWSEFNADSQYGPQEF
jgi:hypothetical protein